MTKRKDYDLRVIVSSCWYGTVTADNAAEAEDLARAAFDDGALRQCEEEVVHVDVRPTAKTFRVTYAVDQSLTVTIKADTANEAAAIIKRRLGDGAVNLTDSERRTFACRVIDATEVTP